MLKQSALKTIVYAGLATLLSACGGGGGGSDAPPAASDPCGNAIGNGNSVINGPTTLPDRINTFDSTFRSLSVHPTDPLTVYVGTEQNGILRSSDGGVTWDRLRMGMRHSGSAYPEIYDIAISASNPDILIAATVSGRGPATEEAPSVGGVYRSTDGGDTWGRKNCDLPNASIASAYISPTNPDVALIGTGAGAPTHTGASASFFPGGIYRTSDGGDSWSEVIVDSLGEVNTFYQLMGRGGSDIYSFGINIEDLSENVGFIRSVDGGASFNAVATPFTNAHISYFTVSADGQRVILIEQDLFELNVSENGGMTWSTNTVVSANGPVRISPHNKDHIVIADNEDLWFSDDGLTTATQVVNGAIDFFQDIEFSASDPLTIYAVTRGYDVYRSQDGGASFGLVLNLRSDVINAVP